MGAGAAWDSTLAVLLTKEGEKYGMSLEQMLAELHNFELLDSTPKEEVRNMNLLLKFVRRENFQRMFVGCVLSSVVPLVYTSVLPTLLETTYDEVEVTTRQYENR